MMIKFIKYIKNYFLLFTLKRQQRKRHKYQDEFNRCLRDVLQNIKRFYFYYNEKSDLMIYYDHENDFSQQIVQDVVYYLKSTGYDVQCSTHDYANEMSQRLELMSLITFKV